MSIALGVENNYWSVPDMSRASEIIELVGGEITWELLNADGTWYVWASHHGETRDESFKFNECGESLDYVVRRVANDVLEWIEEHPQFTGDSK